MPNFSGLWTVTQQMQARGASTWPATPGAPTIGTATQASSTSVSVAFTAPACTGTPASITGYLAKSTPGCFTSTGASSPIVVSGLTTGTAYTFKVKATNAVGYGPCSAASNSVTPVPQSQQAYTTAGTFTWVAPACVTSVSVVAVGAAAGGFQAQYGNGSSGGGLGYKNNITVIPGNSYTVVAGAGGVNMNTAGGNSYFCTISVVKGGGSSGAGGTYTGDGGGNGGCTNGGAGGAGGYSGKGGNGGAYGNGSAGAGGGGGGSANVQNCCGGYAGGGGGVGLLGQGANGAGGTGGGGGTGNAGGGGGGSGGSAGGYSLMYCVAGAAGVYGGGGGAAIYTPARGGGGAVRIIWPGTTRSFPSTNTGNL